MTVNLQQMKSDIRATELRLADMQAELARQRHLVTSLQTDVTVGLATPTEPQVENWIDNGNFDFTRDDYDNAVPVGGDTDEEAARWYSQTKDPSARVSDGAIITGTNALQSATGGFLPGDNGSEIVVEGAGAAGADLVTTIAGVVDANNVTLTANAVNTVTGAVVRWRLQSLVAAPAAALRTRAHSAYAGFEDPDYDKQNGWARIGSGTRDVAAPLNKNWAESSRVCSMKAIARLEAAVTDAAIDIGVDPNTLNSVDAGFIPGDVGRTVTVFGAGPGGTSLEATITVYISPTAVTIDTAASTTVVNARAVFSFTWPAGVQLFAGVWDDSAGRKMFLEGSDFELFSVTIGIPAMTTSSEYLVVALTDFGETVASTRVTVNRPSDASFIPGQVYQALSWANLSGILHYDVYRRTGGTFLLLERLDNGETSFFDVGNTAVAKIVGSFPAAALERQRAYTEIKEGLFTPVAGTWKEFRIVIPIPRTYNKGLTTGRQWLRWGLTGSLVGAGAKRALQVDLIGFNDRDGTFSRSVNDFGAKGQSSTTMTSGSQGGLGTGGSDDGSGGRENLCPAEDEIMIVVDKRGRERSIKAINAKRRMRVLTGSGWFAEIREVSIGERTEMLKLYTELGLVREATPSDRIIRWKGDLDGEELQKLKKGDRVRSYIDGQFFDDRVYEVTKPRKKKRPVRISLLGNDPTFIAGHRVTPIKGEKVGVVGHNLKPFNVL
jgi:hypothetical protein